MMTTGKPVRIGVVGVGFGATVHIPAFQSEGLEVVAICSRRQERAAEAASKFGVGHVFTDYDAMLAMPELDAISIVTPVALHHSMTMAALSAGKHVICEKPFALNAAEAQEMADKARATGATAMIAHEFRFASARMRVKELLDEGYVGTPRLALVRMVSGGFGRPGAAPAQGPAPYNADRDSAAQGAGFLFGLGSHYLDAMCHWFGPVESVDGVVHTFNAERADGRMADADDTFLANLKFRSGVIGQVIGTRSAPFGSGAGMEVYGSGGALTTPHRGAGFNPPPHGTLFGARVGEEKLQEMPIPERLQPFADDRDDRLMPFRLMTREFVRGIATGTSPAPNFDDGLHCQRILDAIRESSATGRRVQIPA